ncbi:MAG: hypothetical protein OEM29_08435 [Thermoplasmata archaeon]|nr:hypothetical protein [Thermoplasmata archaeon]
MDALTAAAMRRVDRTAGTIIIAMTLCLGGTWGALLYATSQASADDASWSPCPSMLYPRAWPEVVVLPNGDIFVIGGYSISGPTATTEVFDVSEKQWKAGPTMAVKRVGHTATLLNDGTVLVTGGETGGGTTDNAEVIDLGKSACQALPDMFSARSGHAAVRLSSGDVLVVGGTDWITGAWSHAEIYDPETHSWVPGGIMDHARVLLSVQLLENGEAIAIGGDSAGTSELFDPSTGEWHGESAMSKRRFDSASIVLASGHVLVAGGVDSGAVLRSAEMYDPETNIWFSAGSMLSQRAQFTLSLLPDGRVLAAGSYSAELGTTSSTELFCQCNMAWSTTTPMAKSRGAHGAAALPTGNILMIGGMSGDSATASAEEYTPPSSLPEPPPPPPPPPYCQPKDILPFVLEVASQMPGHSFHGLVAKVLIAQVYYESAMIEDCLHILDSFYNEVRAFLLNGHVDEEGIASLYAAYAAVVECLGGTPLPEIP